MLDGWFFLRYNAFNMKNQLEEKKLDENCTECDVADRAKFRRHLVREMNGKYEVYMPSLNEADDMKRAFTSKHDIPYEPMDAGEYETFKFWLDVELNEWNDVQDGLDPCGESAPLIHEKEFIEMKFESIQLGSSENFDPDHRPDPVYYERVGGVSMSELRKDFARMFELALWETHWSEEYIYRRHK